MKIKSEHPKFVQICCNDRELYALDEDGKVYSYSIDRYGINSPGIDIGKWEQLSETRSEKQ